MKKNFAFVLGVLLIFGFVLVSCSSGHSGTAPKVTVTSYAYVDGGTDKWIAKTEFAVNEKIGFKIQITDPDKDIKRYGYTVKKGGNIWTPNTERDLYSIPNSDTYTQGVSYWSFDSNNTGTYTFEAYAFDLAGNKSDTATTTFTVK